MPRPSCWAASGSPRRFGRRSTWPGRVPPRGDEPAIVRALADSAGFDADRLRSAISRRRHLPDKATALAVIAAAFGERVNVRDDPD